MASPRVLLINPWIYDFAAFDLWAKPLGLLYIGESLRRKGVEVALIDCAGASDGRKYGTGRFRKQEIPKPKALQGIPRRYSRYGISEEAFLDQLASLPRPDVVLVTATMTYWYPGAFRVIELVRGRLPKTPIILGGIYATLCPGHAARFSGADHVYQGRASSDLFRLLAQYMPLDVRRQRGPGDGLPPCGRSSGRAPLRRPDHLRGLPVRLQLLRLPPACAAISTEERRGLLRGDHSG